VEDSRHGKSSRVERREIKTDLDRRAVGSGSPNFESEIGSGDLVACRQFASPLRIDQFNTGCAGVLDTVEFDSDIVRAARAAKIDLPWDTARAIDLAGRDILSAVQTSVNPKVIDCPAQDGPRSTIDAVAQDGIQLRAKAKVTVRTNIGRLVGGATEETIIARVGEGIVTTIGSAHSHKDVLANPDSISKTVMAKGLDAGTAFEILSIDIADVDVGENIGAQLQVAQANADKQRAQAEAEKRAAMARAQEQEYKAEIQKNKALVTLAEAEVPKAMADAFRKGNMGIMDYYRMRNVQADTSMRSAIAGDGGKPAAD